MWQKRIRELSTIKVLGSIIKSDPLYLPRDHGAVFVGIVLGFGGRLLFTSIFDSNDLTCHHTFYPRVSWEVYALPIVAVTVILALLGLFVNHHLRKVDMLEALKSVE